ncbi:unnamed protein product, partial [Ectocarpus fasciculatus]
MRRSGSATAAAAATLARHANACCRPRSAAALGLLPGAASSSTHRAALSSNSSSSDGGDSSGQYNAPVRRRDNRVNRGRHRWSGQEAAAATTARRAPGGLAGASGQGSAAGAVRALSSSFLADAVRETATNHCIDRVVNGGLDSTVVDKDSPTVEV